MKGWAKAGYGFESEEPIPRMRVKLHTPDELEAAVAADSSMVILDIRDDEFYEAMRLPFENIIHIPFAYLDERINEIPRDKRIFVACHAGKQGFTAGPWLKGKGFDLVGCMDGGIMAWQKAGKAVKK